MVVYICFLVSCGVMDENIKHFIQGEKDENCCRNFKDQKNGNECCGALATG